MISDSQLLTLESAARALLDAIASIRSETLFRPTERVQYAALVVSREYEIRPEDILGRSRLAHLTEARHVAMFLCAKLELANLAAIGQVFDNRDHTAVIYARNRVQDLCDVDSVFAAKVSRLEKELQSSLNA